MAEIFQPKPKINLPPEMIAQHLKETKNDSGDTFKIGDVVKFRQAPELDTGKTYVIEDIVCPDQKLCDEHGERWAYNKTLCLFEDGGRAHPSNLAQAR